MRGEDPARAAAIPAARQSLADLEFRIVQVGELIERLTILAPQDGIVLPPPKLSVSSATKFRAGQIRHSTKQIEGLIETGTLICLVGRPGEVEAVAIVIRPMRR